jgi:2-aminobenzoate-CoA ligase
MEHGVRTTWGATLFGNVERRFLPAPEHLPLLTFGAAHLHKVWSGEPMNACHELLDATVTEHGPDRTAIVTITRDGGARWTYGELLSQVSRLAAGLQRAGVAPGDRVLVRMPDVPHAAIAQLAVWRLGGVVVPSSVLETARELEFMLGDVEATTVICASDHAAELEKALPASPIVQRVVGWPDAVAGGPTLDGLVADSPTGIACHPSAPFDASGIYYTGGTTGLPKGCLHTHAAEVATADLNAWARGATCDSVFLTHAPIGHAFGNGEKINFPLRLGATVVYANRPTPAEMWQTIAEHRVTTLAAAATMYRMMLANASPKDLAGAASLVSAVSSGEVLDETTFDRWNNSVACPVRNTVGMTPMRHLFLDSNLAGVKTAPGLSVGAPLPAYEARLVDADGTSVPPGEPGRLAIRGPSGITYWINQHPGVAARAAQDVRNGWSLLDDAYVRDADGWLWFHGRLDDMIVTGGRQVAPIEVESVLCAHPDVAEACVVAAPDAMRGQSVCAFVRVRDGVTADAALAEALQTFTKAEMAAYKYPRRIEFVAELPKDSVGKIQRRRLREQLVEAELRSDAITSDAAPVT